MSWVTGSLRMMEQNSTPSMSSVRLPLTMRSGRSRSRVVRAKEALVAEGDVIGRVHEGRLEHGQLVRIGVHDEHPRRGPAAHRATSAMAAPRTVSDTMRRTNASSSTGLAT